MAITGSTDFGDSRLLLTVSHDPAVTPTDCPSGSLIVYTVTGQLWIKQDDGSTTNVNRAARINPSTGYVYLSELAGSAGVKDNLTALVAPSASADSVAGYSVGSLWIDTVAKIAYTCTDASVGAAVWPSGASGPPSGPAGGDLSGSYPNPTVGTNKVGNASLAQMAANTVKANATAGTADPADLAVGANTVVGRVAGNVVAAQLVAGQVTTGTLTDTQVAAANKDGVAGTPSMRTLGTGALTACAGNDARLSDARTPTGAAGGDLAGTYPNPAVAQASQAFAFTGVITPATITSSQNDYSPTGLSTATILRLSADASWSLTGLAGGASGRQITFVNVGANPIVLVNESASSTAANRFTSGSDVTIVSGSVVQLLYDATSSRWRPQGGTGGAASGGLLQTQWVQVVGSQTTGVTTFPSPGTTIAAASNNVALPTGTINVASTTGFATAGLLTIETTTGTQTVAYTGTGATTFTGCTGGAGNMSTSGLVRAVVRTTIAAGSDSVALPTGTINVASTANFPASGSLNVYTSAGFQTVAYTGVTATTFTGCTLGTGTMSTGGQITAISSTQDLLTINLTTSGGALIIQFLSCASNNTNNAQAFFRVVVDGKRLRGSSIKANGGSASSGTSVSLKVTGVVAGPHTVVVQWRVGSGTGQVRPAIAEDENASLLVQEVSS